MKNGLLRLTDEKDIFYDSIEKIYRYRMHCSNCGIEVQPCRCYNDLDRLLCDIDDHLADKPCSAKCSLLLWEDDDYLDEIMQEVGLTLDSKKCLSKLTDIQLDEIVADYDKNDVFEALYNTKSNISFLHLRLETCTRDEKIEIIIAMDDVENILWNNNISYHPDIKDLTEEQALKLARILVKEGDFDYPGGEDCTL